VAVIPILPLEQIPMRRWGTFLFGAVVGAAALFFVLNYHIIRARDGMHLVPKVDAQLAGSYVDIRDFGPREWAAHKEVLLALVDADRQDLIGSAADDALRTGLDRLLGGSQSDR
jgi:hypothetical protein